MVRMQETHMYIFREISWALNNLHMLGECFIEQRHQYVLTSVI